MAFRDNHHFTDTEVVTCTQSSVVNGRVYQLHFAASTGSTRQDAFTVSIDPGDNQLPESEYTFYGRGVVSGTFPFVGEGTDAIAITIKSQSGLPFTGNYLLIDGAAS